jgi:hypothetical protein
LAIAFALAAAFFLPLNSGAAVDVERAANCALIAADLAQVAADIRDTQSTVAKLKAKQTADSKEYAAWLEAEYTAGFAAMAKPGPMISMVSDTVSKHAKNLAKNIALRKVLIDAFSELLSQYRLKQTQLHLDEKANRCGLTSPDDWTGTWIALTDSGPVDNSPGGLSPHTPIKITLDIQQSEHGVLKVEIEIQTSASARGYTKHYVAGCVLAPGGKVAECGTFGSSRESNSYLVRTSSDSFYLSNSLDSMLLDRIQFQRSK